VFYIKIGANTTTVAKILWGLGLIIGFLFGTVSHELLIAMLFVQLLDVFTGLLVGGKGGKIRSDRLRRGIATKTGYWVLVVLANIADVILFDRQPIVKTAVLFSLIGNEALSIIENLALLDIFIPATLVKYLEKVKDKGENNQMDLTGSYPEEINPEDDELEE